MGCLSDLVWEMDAPGNGLLYTLNSRMVFLCVEKCQPIFWLVYADTVRQKRKRRNMMENKKHTYTQITARPRRYTPFLGFNMLLLLLLLLCIALCCLSMYMLCYDELYCPVLCCALLCSALLSAVLSLACENRRITAEKYYF